MIKRTFSVLNAGDASTLCGNNEFAGALALEFGARLLELCEVAIRKVLHRTHSGELCRLSRSQ